MKLANAIKLLKKYGTSYREYEKDGSQRYAADVNGWTIGFWQHCTNSDKSSACTIQKVCSHKACFSGKSISMTIRRCLSGFYDR